MQAKRFPPLPYTPQGEPRHPAFSLVGLGNLNASCDGVSRGKAPS